MKRKIALAICLMFCLSLLSNAVYAVQETVGKKEQQKQEQKITSIEELPEEIRNSTWFKNGLKNGVYDSFNSLDMIGKWYMGETISDILLMNEEIKDFKLNEFFKHTVFSVYSINDLKSFMEQGLKTMDEIYEQIYLPGKEKTKKAIKNIPILRAAGDQWANMSVTKTRIESFQLAGKPAHGQLWNIKLDGETGFCAGYGMAARNGYSYQRTSNMTDANIGSAVQEKQVQQAIGFFVDEYITTGVEQKWVDEGYLITQTWIWMSLDGASDSQIASDIPNYVFGDTITAEQKRLLKEKISAYQASGRKMDRGNVFFYRNPTVSSAQPVITFQGKPSTPTGWAKVRKQSSKPEITNGNNSYSLAGAEYGIFTDEGCTNKVATLTTNSNGESNTAELNAGTYWLKELKAPYGFALNDTSRSIEIAAEKTKTFDVVNIPQLDPVDVLLGKIDRETTINKPEGSASLAGAEFTVKYYPNLVDDVAGLIPKYTWKVVTDEYGWGEIPKNELPYIVDGLNTPRYGLPVGTITIQETKAPTGYLINDTVYLRKITSDGDAIGVDTYNAPIIPEQVIRGGFKMQKTDKETGQAQAQGAASLQNATYTVTNISGQSVRVGGRDYANNTVCYTFKTDENGRFTSPANLLPYGDYRINETVASNGYLVNTGWSVNVNVRTNGAIVDTTGSPTPEQVIRGGFKIQKTDKETGRTQAQGMASLQNATYTVTNISGQSVRVGGRDYANNTVCYTFKTDENGEFTSPANLLPYGDYRINETVASSGYLVNTTWSATLNIRTNGAIVDLTVNPTPEQVIRGGFKMQKTDKETGLAQAQGMASLQNATFTVTNVSGKSVRVGGKNYANNAVVYTFKTDENGRFTSPDNLLPYGNYRINETTPSNGYLVNTGWSALVQIRTNGTIVDLTGNPVPEQIIRGGFKIQKRDKETGQAIPQGLGSLQNATFTVANISGKSVRVGGVDYPNNTVVYTFTTDENGRFTSPANLLPYGNYRIREKTPSEGYLLNATWFADVNIRANGVIVDITNNPTPEQVIRGGFKMQKTDKETGQAKPQGAASLKDATFTVANISGRSVRVGGVNYPNNTVVYTFKTDENGRYTSPADLLPYGNYRIREKTPSEGYLLNTQWFKDVYIRENGVIVNITNDPVPEQVIKGGLQLVKFKSGDNNLKTPLAGVEFTLTNQSDGQQVVIVTDENGYADTGRYALAYGEWKVEETKTPDGLMPIPPFTVDVKENGKIFYFIVENDTIFSAVQLIKTDVETGQPVLLADTEFQIRNADTGDILEFVDYYPTYHTFTVLKTDNLGMCMLPQRLEMGRYELVEIKAPYEYLLDITPLTFEVTGGSEYNYPLEVRFADKPVKGKAELTKVDSITLQPLMGVEFSVYAREDIISADNTIHYMQGELVEIITTDEKGYACTKELRPGKYYLKESKTIDGYVLNETEYDFEIVAGDNLTPVVKVDLGNISNEPTKVDFVKTDIETGQPIQGVAFELYDIEGNKLYSWMSDTTPHRINALPQGEYILKEVETVYGYLLHNSEIRFTVENTADVQTVKVDNQPIKGAASLYKTDGETKNPLEGFEFGVYAREDVVTLDGTVRAAKDELVDTITTDGEGMAKTKELYLGKYYFKEHKAAYGYLISEQEYDFELKAEDNITPVIEIDTVSVFNQSIKGVASLYKTDGETQNPLEGFEFGVYAREDILTLDGTVRAAKDELVDTITTDGEGMARTKELYLGKYYFKEHKAAYGYLMSEEEYDFELKAENNDTPLIEIDTVSIFNQSIKGTASLYKTDGETQNPLEGFEFGVYAREDIVTLDGTVRAAKDELVDTITTDGGGMAKTKELYLGKYYFKEHKAAYGYLISDKEYDFELKAKDNITPVIEIDTVSVFNQPIKGIVDGYKVGGDTKKPLSGVEFGVYAREDIVTLDGTVRTAKDELADTVTTDDNGYFKTKELYLGKYYLREHKTIAGYILSQEEYDFELVAPDNNSAVFTYTYGVISNEAVVVPPSPPDSSVPHVPTGDNTNTLVYIGITVLSFIGLYLIYKRKKA